MYAEAFEALGSPGNLPMHIDGLLSKALCLFSTSLISCLETCNVYMPITEWLEQSWITLSPPTSHVSELTAAL